MNLNDNIRRIFVSDKHKSGEKNTVCVLPWLHLNITPGGKVLQCCMTSDCSAFAGDLKKQSLEEVWNSKFMRTLRRQMLAGVAPETCSNCFANELASGNSNRLAQNGFYKDKLAEIPSITNKDGSVDNIELRHWDFRFSNFCNYKCRTCGPDASTSWIPDAKKLGWITDETGEKPRKIESIDQDPNVVFLKKYIDKVQQINFAGGEPLLMDEHWQIMDMLDECKRYDVIVSYTSNLSILKYRNKNALDYWTKWGRNIILMPSIDEIGERAELIRSGTDWNNVETNLKTIINSGVYIKPNITISAMNVFRIPEILNFLLEAGIIRQEDGYKNFEINMVTAPERFHISILPDTFRKNIRIRLEEYINDFEKKYHASIKDHFSYLFWHLEKPRNKVLCAEFIEFTKNLDLIRGEDTFKTIPELSCILDS